MYKEEGTRMNYVIIDIQSKKGIYNIDAAPIFDFIEIINEFGFLFSMVLNNFETIHEKVEAISELEEAIGNYQNDNTPLKISLQALNGILKLDTKEKNIEVEGAKRDIINLLGLGISNILAEHGDPQETEGIIEILMSKIRKGLEAK